MIEKDEQLSPEAAGREEHLPTPESKEEQSTPLIKEEDSEVPSADTAVESEAPSADTPAESEVPTAETPAESEALSEDTPAESEAPDNSKATEVPLSNSTVAKEEDKIEEEEAQDTIDEANAEDAEDDDNNRRHQIPVLDYESMSMENLVGELQRLVRTEKVQAINTHVNQIKSAFDQQFKAHFEEKKEEFLLNGGNEIDFRLSSVAKRQFNEVFKEYREKRDAYYKNLEKQLESNLQNRLGIIEELKSLINVEEDMNNTYQNFKNLQEKWRNAGPVPRNKYNDVWRTYHHHTEIFYDFLHLNRELRDLDFKHNLEEKQKLVERAEALVDEPDLSKAFFELQTLHKIWKEDVGPVAKEHREAIWERFSEATKKMHQRRQEHFKALEAGYEINLEKKNQLIASILEQAETLAKDHKTLQKQMKSVEALREEFFKAGKVPQKVNEQTWSRFKEAVRQFNRKKNSFYKDLKKEQQQNLEKKRNLLALAEALKDSEDYEMATPEMKRIQSEWKKIGHVPRKYSDQIWKEFKAACNHYFDRVHDKRDASQKAEVEHYEQKRACLERLKEFKLSGKREDDLKAIKGFIAEWKSFGRIPQNKLHINNKFNKIIDALFKKLDIDKQESELLKYGDKISRLSGGDDDRAIQKERSFIRKKINESNSEIRQLENNLQFFSNASEDNPLVKEVIANITRHKEALDTWKAKLKKLNILENQRNKQAEEESAEESETQEQDGNTTD